MFGLMAPLAGIRVVEAALGVSVVGAGLASSLPGSLLRDLGADVARVQSRTRSALDQNIELLVAARAGLLSQIRAHRPGPAFADLAIAGAGAGLSAAVGALSLLYQREGTGQGGWAETSLYDGITALLPMIIGRVEHHSPTTKLLWQNRGPSEALSYRCADGEYVQLWFGAKGAFDAFLAHIGDPPSERGYNAELMSDAMVEAGQGGAGQPPTYLVWGAIDAAGGWMSACGILAGLYARRSRGGGQSVSASLLGAALTLKSGAFIAAGEVVGGPVLDPGQTGYGAAYRIYQGADGAWFALAVPDEQAWRGLLSVVHLPQLPNSTPSLRTDRGDSQPEELLLEAAFRTRPAAAWVAALRAEGVPVEPVATPDREGFAAGFTDDPVNRQLGRVVGYRWGDHGSVRQPSFPPRIGPGTPLPPMAGIPGLGEHTAEFLETLGFDAAFTAKLTAKEL